MLKIFFSCCVLLVSLCCFSSMVYAQTAACPSGYTETNRTATVLKCTVLDAAPSSMEEAEELKVQLTASCTAFAGATLVSSSTGFASAGGWFAQAACDVPRGVTNARVCPTGFVESFRNETILMCNGFSIAATSDEAKDLQTANKDVCTATMAAAIVETYGPVSTSTSGFIAYVNCQITLPIWGEFVNSSIVRACDATCTQEAEQTRVCINGDIGIPNCLGTTTQTVIQECNTGTAGLCPFSVVPPTMLLLDEE